MSLEGLRAWIGEVERKLGKRTRVFLALSAIAIGIAGAAAYLAIDARDSSVSESDVQELQQELEARIEALETGGATPPATTPPVEAEPLPEPESATPKQDGGATDGASGGGGGGGPAEGDGDDADATGGAVDPARIQELLQQAEERSEAGE
jgi:hypothetical protein